jgi:hypothetical protein
MSLKNICKVKDDRHKSVQLLRVHDSSCMKVHLENSVRTESRRLRTGGVIIMGRGYLSRVIKNSFETTEVIIKQHCEYIENR